MLATIGKTVLPYDYKGTIRGTYTDTTTRIIEVTIEKSAETLALPQFPTQPRATGAMLVVSKRSNIALLVGLMGSRVSTTNADQMVVTVDRGYYYEVNGLAQPGAYLLPVTGGYLTYGTPGTQGMEANMWAKGFHTLIRPFFPNDIVAGVLGTFAVLENDPEDMTVLVLPGRAYTDDSIIYFDAPQEVAIEPVWAEGEDDYLMKARVYINKISGEIEVVYGAAHVDAPVAPDYPEYGIKLAAIDLVEGVEEIKNDNITDERELGH